MLSLQPESKLKGSRKMNKGEAVQNMGTDTALAPSYG